MSIFKEVERLYPNSKVQKILEYYSFLNGWVDKKDSDMANPIKTEEEIVRELQFLKNIGVEIVNLEVLCGDKIEIVEPDYKISELLLNI
jgi:hypothetical protein